MPPRIALILEEGDERFRFYYDDEEAGLLHVVARRTTTVDAIRTFFEGQVIGW